MTLIVGLTGGIGSGKTQVADILAGLGVGVVDADVVAREVVAPDTHALGSIAQHFGSHLLDQKGYLRRSELRQIIFSDKQAKAWLESLLHPLIQARIKLQLDHLETPYGVLVSPLLLETEQQQLVQKVIVVDAKTSQQSARASSRDASSVAQIEAIMDTQMPRQERLAAADMVVDNTRDLAYLHKEVEQLHQCLLTLAESEYA
ncbi:MAG: dephospho-CoA kinase [Gammaproteobacteria bacterium]|jgi:dephospho-CoA kinase|nr:dephospho-CoA kinase [Gammaproteobacteria bacterium]